MENKKRTKIARQDLRYNFYSKYPSLKGWKYLGFISGIIGFFALSLYPIIIDPMINTEKYKEIQAETRKGINQESIQPGNMRVWSNPFAPRNDTKTV